MLIIRMKQGSEDAFDTFIRKHYAQIFRYCRYHCTDSWEAEDITQETFYAFFRHLDSYRHMGKVRNYLYITARNLCINRVKKGTEDSTEEEVLDGKLVTDGGIMEEENHLLVEQVLRKLPSELREVVILHYFQELRLSEIADILNISLPLVKYRHRRAKELLRKYLGEEE